MKIKHLGSIIAIASTLSVISAIAANAGTIFSDGDTLNGSEGSFIIGIDTTSPSPSNQYALFCNDPFSDGTVIIGDVECAILGTYASVGIASIPSTNGGFIPFASQTGQIKSFGPIASAGVEPDFIISNVDGDTLSIDVDTDTIQSFSNDSFLTLTYDVIISSTQGGMSQTVGGELFLSTKATGFQEITPVNIGSGVTIDSVTPVQGFAITVEVEKVLEPSSMSGLVFLASLGFLSRLKQASKVIGKVVLGGSKKKKG